MLLFSQATAAQQVTWPEITSENKPWTRWWWPGSIVTQTDLTAAMETYKQAGLGGMEIAVIYGVKGQEDKFINYLSPKWMEMFIHTLKEGERLNLGIDLANASGWPFGGPWVDPADACKNINFKTYSLKTGESLSEKIEFIQQPLVRPVGQKPDIAKLVDPIAKNKNLQLYALDQIRFEKPLPLKTLMAYSDSGTVINLTSRVTSEKTLNWVAPSGNWTLYALFEGWHGKMAERAGPGGEGDVIDHFSGKAIDTYLEHFDMIFKDYDIKSLRGYFNDSYEVDDASGQANWTNDLFNEFFIRRGYDLRSELPALFQKDTPDKNSRVLSDYRQTIADLILEKFTTRWTAWANKQGKTTRNQAHGSPGNILDLYAASDIPETEGNEITKLKFASSAANVTGKKYASCEAATWLGEHFTSSLADVRKAADLFFLGGINHLFYHGTCFSPQNEPWPGFLFYAAVEFTPANSFWNDFSKLNSYIARVQSFLQSGKSDNDILLYFPIFDRYSDYGRGMLEHFDAISPAYNGTPFKTGAETMLEEGYSFDYISDLQIMNTDAGENLLQTQGNTYKTLVIPGSKYIPIETFSQVLRLASSGANIIIFGNLPENVAGWADMESRSDDFRKMKEGLIFKPTKTENVSEAIVGNGKIILGTDLNSLLTYAGIKREPMSDRGIKFVRRETKTGFCYFINNQSDKAFKGWLPLSVKASYAAIYNPMTEKTGTAQKRISGNGESEVYMNLKAGESMIIETSSVKYKGKPYLFFDPASEPLDISGTWKVEFIRGGPTLPEAKEVSTLISWTDFGGDDLKNFSGTAKYTISFNKPAGKADAYSINFGKVFNSVKVTLNGKEVGTLIGPDFSIEIDKSLVKSVNTLELNVSNLMANRIAYLDRNKIEWKKFYNVNMAARLKENNRNGIFDASEWKPLESGLIGPVTITPLKSQNR
ncbi:MAG: glycoside hydrolase family 2 protein [Bacteroidales bacterium]|nr:glycoside hydrolase family 2 protein [Bacteroidales bacterium]